MHNNGRSGCPMGSILRPAASVGNNGAGSSMDDSRLHQAMEEYLQLLQSGVRPDRDAFLARYPEVAGALAACLQGLDFVHAAGLQMSGEEAAGDPDGPANDTVGTPLELLGDFRIVREVGRGGMGVVYEAIQLSLGRRVALKVLPFAAALDQRQRQRFHNEAHAAAQLHHTHIVPVFGVGCERGVHFYAMQYIDGHSVADLLAVLRQPEPSTSQDGTAAPVSEPEGTTAYTPPPAQGSSAEKPSTAAVLSTMGSAQDPAYFRTVARLGIEAAEALEHAHQMGVVHRDVKPGNLMLDARGSLWITDFGLAQMQSGTQLTQTGDLVGTLRYMSPEQALARRVAIDHRTDVYSLGVTLYEMLTLTPPFAGNDCQELLRQIAFEEPRPLRKRNRAIPAELETVVLKAVEKNPAERYATAQELADDLRRFLEDRPVLARRPTLLHQVRKWARRHQAVVTTAAVALLVVLLTAVASLAVGLALVEEQKQQKEQEAENARLAEAKEREARQQAEKSATREKTAREAEELRRQQAEEVTQLLKSIFRGLARGQEELGGPELKQQLIAQLNDAAGRLDQVLVADPLARAQLQAVLGKTLTDLGDYTRGVPLLEQAFAERRTRLGPDDPDTLKSMMTLAGAYQEGGGLDKALPLNEQTVAKCQELLGPEHLSTLDMMANLALTYHHARQMDRALPLYEQALALTAAMLGPDQQKTVVRLSNLALAYAHMGQRDKSLRLYEDTLVLSRAAYGPDDYYTLLAMLSLAEEYWEAGHPGKALSLQEQALARLKEKAPNHYLTLNAVAGQANVYRLSGQLDRALPLLEESLEKLREKVGPDHRDTLDVMCDLASAYEEAGKLAKAEELYRSSLERSRKAFGAETVRTANHLANLGVFLLHRQKLPEAELLLRQALAIRTRKQPDEWTTFNAQSLLGGALLGQKKYAEAEPLLLAGYHGMKQRLPQVPRNGKVHLTKALERLVQLYTAQSQPDKAQHWRKELESWRAVQEKETRRLKKELAEAQANPSNVLKVKSVQDATIDMLREALRIKNDYRLHLHLAAALFDKGLPDEARAELQEGSRLKNELVGAHFNRAHALTEVGRGGEAIREYRKVLRIQPNWPEARCNLGLALMQNGQFCEARDELRLGHQLGSSRPGWRYPSAQWLQRAEYLANLDAQLPRLLDGTQKPDSVAQRLDVARICILRKKYSVAECWYREAFAAEPSLVDDLAADHRYNAACAAALAGCGHDADANAHDDQERARLRREALDWLKADLQAWQQVLQNEPEKARSIVAEQMKSWLADPDFNDVRGAKAISLLPEGERAEWLNLWEEVEALRKRAWEAN